MTDNAGGPSGGGVIKRHLKGHQTVGVGAVPDPPHPGIPGEMRLKEKPRSLLRRWKSVSGDRSRDLA